MKQVRLQTSCTQRLPQSCPLMDSPNPRKTQSTVGTLLSIYTGPRQPVMSYYRFGKAKGSCHRGIESPTTGQVSPRKLRHQFQLMLLFQHYRRMHYGLLMLITYRCVKWLVFC